MDRGTWQATVHGTHKRVRHDLATKQQLIILTTPVTYLGQSIVIRCFTFLKPYTINFYKVKQENVELNIQFSSVHFLSRVSLFVTPWIRARQASLSITNSWSSLKLTSDESVMPSSHLIPCHPLLLLSPIPPSIRVFYNESTLRMRWPKFWSFSFSISPSSEYSGLISFIIDWFDLLAIQGTLKTLLQYCS